jgi:hypothetical protein
MKKLLIFLFIIGIFQIVYALPQQLEEIQKQVAVQAGALQNSPIHQQFRLNQPSRSYIVGDTHIFWRWNLSVMPPTWIQTPATCRAVGEHCYVFVADSDWNVHMTQANVDTVLVRLEDRTVNDPTLGVIEMDMNEFGPIPNELDNDPKLIVFYSALGQFNGSQFDGYFSAYNEVTEAEAQQMNPSGHSNQCEMIYMTCYPLNPVAPVRLSVLAHELTHMIEWGLDPNEEIWLDEGCAELAMVKYGVPDPITGFNTTPDNSLIVWNQAFADYVKVMLFFTYLSEHYDTNHLIREIVADQSHGLTSISNMIIANVTDMTLDEIFKGWTIANYLDKPQPDSGLYNYEQLTLPAFSTAFHYTQPIVDVTDISGSVQPWAADYIKIDQNIIQHQANFTGNHPFDLSVIAIPSNTANEIVVNTNTLNDNFEWFNFYWDGSYVLVVSNPSEIVLNYTFSIHSIDAVDDNTTPTTTAPSLACYPNPFNMNANMLNIQVKNVNVTHQNIEANIYNIKGQLVSKMELRHSSDEQVLYAQWNGKDLKGNIASSGIYFIRYNDGSKTLSKKVIVLR